MICSLCQTGKTDIPALKSGEFFSVVTDTTTTSAYKCSYRKIQIMKKRMEEFRETGNEHCSAQNKLLKFFDTVCYI